MTHQASTSTPYRTSAPVLSVTCTGRCRVLLAYGPDEPFETFDGTGPYEMECQRLVVRCCVCRALIDVPRPIRSDRTSTA